MEMPTIAELMLREIDHEMPGTRRTLERVPEGKNDWQPHDKSMPLGYLAGLVATMPGWIESMVRDEALDLAVPGRYQTLAFPTTRELLAAFDAELERARTALGKVGDEHLLDSRWQLRMKDQVLVEQSRFEAIRWGALNHLYHHRAQLTTYLRLNDRPVPSLYGPSADEQAPPA